MAEVSFINMDAGVVVMDDTTLVPITNMFDEWGDDCDVEQAVVIVFGPFDGEWLTMELDGELETVH